MHRVRYRTVQRHIIYYTESFWIRISFVRLCIWEMSILTSSKQFFANALRKN